MKKLILISIALLMAANSFALEYEPTWRRADWAPITSLKISSAAVDDYSALRNKKNYIKSFTPNDLTRAVLTKRAFVKYMSDSYKKRYPQYKTVTPYDFENSQATASNFKGAQLYHSNVIFFAGLGSQQALAFHDKIAGVGDKAFGGDIKWVFLDASLVLNVNKDGQLNKGAVSSARDLQKFNRLKDAFIGVHAILGYYLMAFEMSSSADAGKRNSEVKYKYFAEYFIEEDLPLWEAYKKAHKKYYDDNKDVGIGYEPAIAYIKGTDQYGRQHDASTEKFSSTYEVAMDPRRSDRNYTVQFYTQKYGTPAY